MEATRLLSKALVKFQMTDLEMIKELYVMKKPDSLRPRTASFNVFRASIILSKEE